jgi:beta-mannosidase
MGIVYWQLNSEWPGASKSGLERFGRWKLLHHAMVDSYANQLVTTAVVNNTIAATIINDDTSSLETTVTLQWLSIQTGAVIASTQHPLLLLPASATVLSSSILPPADCTWATCVFIAGARASNTANASSLQSTVLPDQLREGAWAQNVRFTAVRLGPTTFQLQASAVAVHIQMTSECMGVFHPNFVTLFADSVHVTFVPENDGCKLDKVTVQYLAGKGSDVVVIE